QPAYGASEQDRTVEIHFCELFEKEVEVILVGTGTAANCLALSAFNRPGGVVFCHRESHLIEDEGGAPEFLTGGARLAPIDGLAGRIEVDRLRDAINQFDPNFVHRGQPMAVSITQATELGTVYTPNETKAIAAVAHEAGLPLHMDGARFANALVHLDVSAAELTWQSGVDVMSFGATKNGCWCAEAIIFFHPEQSKPMPFLRKRAAQLFSKSRFMSSQFDAYLTDSLWIKLARHANTMASQLAQEFESLDGIRLAWQPQSNEVFAIMEHPLADQLTTAGAKFYPWPTLHLCEHELSDREGLFRFVTSFATTENHITDLASAIRVAVANLDDH
ncbi:MAG: low specificity L-threonine aldolase, partial [Planctomycetota bacterium]